jgi:hypothetical protein
MAEVINTNVFDAEKKFVDFAGLDYFWEKAKAYVDGADDAALTDAKTYVDGRFNNEVTGKFDTVGSAAAVQGNLDSHVADAVAHITADERTAWNGAKTAIDAFLKDADMTADAVDTLAELQTYMNNDGAAATQLVNRVAALEAVKDDYKAADTALETSLKGYVDGKDSAMDARVKVLEGQDVYVKNDVDAAIADAKKAGTDASAALEAYKPVIEKSVTDAQAAAIAQAKLDTAEALKAYYTKTEVDTAVADAKKAGTDASAALEAYKPVIEKSVTDAKAAAQAYAKQYTDELYGSFQFASNSDIDALFA